MGKYGNNSPSLIKCICLFLNSLYEDISFVPEQLLKNEEFLSVSGTGKTGAGDVFLNGKTECYTEFRIVLRSSGDSSYSRYKSHKLLEDIMIKLRQCNTLSLSDGMIFSHFEMTESPRVAERENSGDDIFSMRFNIWYFRTEAV